MGPRWCSSVPKKGWRWEEAVNRLVVICLANKHHDSSAKMLMINKNYSGSEKELSPALGASYEPSVLAAELIQ